MWSPQPSGEANESESRKHHTNGASKIGREVQGQDIRKVSVGMRSAASLRKWIPPRDAFIRTETSNISAQYTLPSSISDT